MIFKEKVLAISFLLAIPLHPAFSSDENKETDRNDYDVNNAPLPSLHDGPQQNARWPQTTTEKIHQHKSDHHQHRFVHKIENSPLPSAHEGPQPLKMAKRSLKTEEVYNYGIGSNDDNRNRFSGYYSSSNIGVIPPRNVDARDYYNKVSNLPPILEQHGGVYSEFVEKNMDSLPQYGRNGVKFDSNAYRNVLTGLLMWNNINNPNIDQFVVYTNTNVTEKYRNLCISSDTVGTCGIHQIVLCGENSSAVCANDKSIFCIKSKENDEDKKCINSITIEKIRLGGLGEESSENLCVIAVAVPKTN